MESTYSISTGNYFNRNIKKEFKKKNVDPYILLKVDNKNLTASIDTGSAVTLVKSSALKNISNSYKCKKDFKTPSLFAVNGSRINTYGTHYLRVKLGQRETSLTCVEVDDQVSFNGEVLLGIDFHVAEALTFDFDEMLLSYKDQKIL